MLEGAVKVSQPEGVEASIDVTTYERSGFERLGIEVTEVKGGGNELRKKTEGKDQMINDRIHCLAHQAQHQH